MLALAIFFFDVRRHLALLGVSIKIKNNGTHIGSQKLGVNVPLQELHGQKKFAYTDKTCHQRPPFLPQKNGLSGQVVSELGLNT